MLIRAGLNKACSKMPPAVFDFIQKQTNAAEQTHWKSYIRGKQLPLLQALIEYVISTLKAFNKTNIF